ncbi:hydrogenase expression/formation C-terminal domain-containing protein [Thiohalorhabdus methylotrophus]|uniref:Hydrogenase expression/formation C-terminal domain-containing protein n=1 Tax=Thiohalorhabdus methylotrophus TaxID=3242694 RepID=A0ABV4TT71_9GAMM
MSAPELHCEGLPAPVVTLLQEIAVHLDRLVREGVGGAVDLRGLSALTREDLERLRQVLEVGEVQATVESLGKTVVQETGLPGVWWVRYQDRDGARAAERIEVARVPDILVAQSPDISAGLHALVAQLPDGSGAPEDTAPPSISWRDD